MKAKTEDLLLNGDNNCISMQANDNSENISTAVSINSSTDVKAINSNTFVVKLKSCETEAVQSKNDLKPDVNQELSPIPSLLQLVQGNPKNKIQIVKSFGSHKIILNKPSLRVHAKPVGNASKITIITTPNRFGNSPIIKKISNLPSKSSESYESKNSAQSLNSLKTKENEEKENQGSNTFKINKNMILTTNGHSLTETSKFTFNFAAFSNIKQENTDHRKDTKPLSESTPIHVSIPNLRPLSPLKSIDDNLKSKIEKDLLQDDGDLTNLSWLCNGNNIIKDFPLNSSDEFGLFSDEEENDKTVKMEKLSPNRGIFTASARLEGHIPKLPPKIEQNPVYNPNGKPPYSFSCLIFMAIEDSLAKKLPVKAIYNWVCKHFPYFYSAPPGWKNSIRHNLSLNKCFKKADVEQGVKDPTKGSLWCIDPAYRPNLIQALKRTPFYPYIHPSGIGQPLSLSNLANLLPGAHSGRIPLWSPNLSATNTYSRADPDVASAALNLLGLKSKDDELSSRNIQTTIKELQREIVERGCWPCPWNSLNRSESCSSLDSSEDGMVVSRDSKDDHNYTRPFNYLIETHEAKTPLSPESDKSAPDAAYEFETGGTDEDEFYDEIDHDEIVDSSDSDDDNLADSGFGVGTNRNKRVSEKNNRKRKHFNDKINETSPKVAKVGNNRKQVSKESKKMKVKLVPKIKKRDDKKSGMKKKKPQNKADSSDVDSGKDSPKVARSRSYRKTLTKTETQETVQNEYKKTYPKPLLRHRSKGIYSTRSTAIARTSKRLAGKYSSEESIRPRRSRKTSISGALVASTDDEEVKLAAGSLMHLAGLNSSPTVVS